MQQGKIWAVVLADGDTATGPVRFASPTSTSLRTTIAQLRRVVSRARIYAVVDDDHSERWRGQVWSLPASAVIRRSARQQSVTALLVALLAIEQQDPQARVLIVPDGLPEMLLGAILAASGSTLELAQRRQCVVLLGNSPEAGDHADHAPARGLRSIAAASVATLLRAWEEVRPEAIAQLRSTLRTIARGAHAPRAALQAALPTVAPAVELGHGLLHVCAHRLHVLDVAGDLPPVAIGPAVDPGSVDAWSLQMMH